MRYPLEKVKRVQRDQNKVLYLVYLPRETLVPKNRYTSGLGVCWVHVTRTTCYQPIRIQKYLF